MTPACYVLSAAELSGVLDAFGNALIFVTLVGVLSHVDWWLWERRVRRFLRRRRLARIRAARVSA